VSGSQIIQEFGQADDGPHAEALLALLSQLIRTVVSSQRGVDAVLDDLCRVAARAMGADGARVVRLMEGTDRQASKTPAGVTPLRGPPPPAADMRSTFGRPEPSMRLQSGERVLGFLELIGRPAEAWTDRDEALATVFAELATSCLTLDEERARASDLSEVLEHRATHDELTGLPNRGLLLDRLEHALLADARGPGVVAVMFIDIDDFKELNDTHGHSCGDRVLVSVAERLAGCLRAGDTVGRLGGDEFLIVCENLVGRPTVINRRLRALGQRLQTRLASPWAGELKVAVSVSIGVALGSRPHDARELIRSADRAMYRAKELGGGRLVFSDPDVIPLDGRRASPSRPRSR
jgi:diguanylate cyclase (GGDEF)-like protein